MAEWFKRSTVNTFYRGSIPLKALLKKLVITKGYNSCCAGVSYY